MFYSRPREGCLQPECVIVTPTRELAIQVYPQQIKYFQIFLFQPSLTIRYLTRRANFHLAAHSAQLLPMEVKLGSERSFFYKCLFCSGVATGSQLPQISEGCNLLVATPGRLVCHHLKNIKTLKYQNGGHSGSVEHLESGNPI